MAKPVPSNIDTDLDVLVAELGWKRTGSSMLVTALWAKACKGDVNAAKLIRELNGETTVEDGAVDYSSVSDAALRKLISSDIFRSSEPEADSSETEQSSNSKD